IYIELFSSSIPDKEVIEDFREKSEENPNFYKLIDSFSDDVMSNLTNEVISFSEVEVNNFDDDLYEDFDGDLDGDVLDDKIEKELNYIDGLFNNIIKHERVSRYLVELLKSVEK
ncbi:hypothetical protein ACLSZ5_09655, partial [Avibacterium avium]|uniref:hypothetical protein n=1 Tax=Avibacterium avium TaxID=751 RepID=UPI003BF80FF3